MSSLGSGKYQVIWREGRQCAANRHLPFSPRGHPRAAATRCRSSRTGIVSEMEHREYEE